MDLLTEIPVGYLVAAFFVTLVASTVQGTVGLGFAIFSVPLLSLIDPRLAPVPQLLLSVPLTVTMALRERHAIDVRGIAWVLVGRIPGAGLGTILLVMATKRILDVIIAVIVLFAVAVLSTRRTIQRTAVTEFFAGVASAASSLVSSIGGPPLALLYRDATGPTIRANLATIFSIGLVISITARVLAERILLVEVAVAVVMVPALFLGLVLSKQLQPRVEGAVIRRAVLVVCTVAGVALLGRALVG